MRIDHLAPANFSNLIYNKKKDSKARQMDAEKM